MMIYPHYFERQVNMRKTLFLLVCFFIPSCLFAITTAGLQAYYAFEENVQDSSGNERHGTEYGDINYTWGAIGQAKSLNASGTYDYVLMPNSLGTDYTVSLFTRMENVDGHNSILTLDESGAWSGSYFWIFTSHSRLAVIHNKIDLRYNAFESAFLASPTLSNNAIYGISVTYSNANQTLDVYLNGLLYTHYTNVPAFPSVSTQLNVGLAPASKYQLNGWVDELRIYDRVLLSSEIGELAVPEFNSLFLFVIAIAGLYLQKKHLSFFL